MSTVKASRKFHVLIAIKLTFVRAAAEPQPSWQAKSEFCHQSWRRTAPSCLPVTGCHIYQLKSPMPISANTLTFELASALSPCLSLELVTRISVQR
ncbi:hypothetical protein BC835DRAFT_1084268 [Cytidiella melzeri]|nr:hypothetical protein BC835DRAFT_1084268 [Cytidiella melzeri]